MWNDVECINNNVKWVAPLAILCLVTAPVGLTLQPPTRSNLRPWVFGFLKKAPVSQWSWMLGLEEVPEGLGGKQRPLPRQSNIEATVSEHDMAGPPNPHWMFKSCPLPSVRGALNIWKGCFRGRHLGRSCHTTTKISSLRNTIGPPLDLPSPVGQWSRFTVAPPGARTEQPRELSVGVGR